MAKSNVRESQAHNSSDSDVQTGVVDAQAGSTGYTLVTLARQHQAYLDALTAQYGISSAHVPLLNFLWSGNTGGTQNEIARALKVDKGTVSRAVRTLVNADLITQTQCAHDTRACTIDLTPQGWALAEPITEMASKWASEVTSDFSDADRAKFAEGLSRIAERAERLLEQAQAERARMAIESSIETLQPNTAAVAMLAEPEGF